mmetsp:Transcript_29028/g.66729  ORF Transcript_29028/g.66729 Transcript_29028/m.66729 type:complete len:327 (+) Transcript_29028:1458-2438(+)
MQPCLCCLLAHDYGPKLAMIANEDYLLGAHHDRNQALRFSCLSGLINQNLLEAEVLQARVTSTDACSANHICSLQEFTLGRCLKLLELLLIAVRELTHIILEREQLLELLVVRCIQVSHLVMQRQEVYAACNSLTALGTKTHHLQASLVQLLSQLVHSDVGWSTHKHLPLVLSSEPVHNCSACNRLSSSWRSLNEAQWILKCLSNSIHLGVVELWQVGGREVPWQGASYGLLFHIVTKKLVVKVARHTRVINSECSHGSLHTVKRGRLPHELDSETAVDIPRSNLMGTPQLQCNLLVCCYLGHMSYCAPAGLVLRTKVCVGRAVQA